MCEQGADLMAVVACLDSELQLHRRRTCTQREPRSYSHWKTRKSKTNAHSHAIDISPEWNDDHDPDLERDMNLDVLKLPLIFCCLWHRWRNKITSFTAEEMYQKLRLHGHCLKQTVTFVDNLVNTDCSPPFAEEILCTDFGHVATHISQLYIPGMGLSPLKQIRKSPIQFQNNVEQFPHLNRHRSKNTFKNKLKPTEKPVTAEHICNLESQQGRCSNDVFVTKSLSEPAEDWHSILNKETSNTFEIDFNPNLTPSLVTALTAIIAEESSDLCVGDMMAEQLVCLEMVLHQKHTATSVSKQENNIIDTPVVPVENICISADEKNSNFCLQSLPEPNLLIGKEDVWEFSMLTPLPVVPVKIISPSSDEINSNLRDPNMSISKEDQGEFSLLTTQRSFEGSQNSLNQPLLNYHTAGPTLTDSSVSLFDTGEEAFRMKVEQALHEIGIECKNGSACETDKLLKATGNQHEQEQELSDYHLDNETCKQLVILSEIEADFETTSETILISYQGENSPAVSDLNVDIQIKDTCDSALEYTSLENAEFGSCRVETGFVTLKPGTKTSSHDTLCLLRDPRFSSVSSSRNHVEQVEAGHCLQEASKEVSAFANPKSWLIDDHVLLTKSSQQNGLISKCGFQSETLANLHFENTLPVIFVATGSQSDTMMISHSSRLQKPLLEAKAVTDVWNTGDVLPSSSSRKPTDTISIQFEEKNSIDNLFCNHLNITLSNQKNLITSKLSHMGDFTQETVVSHKLQEVTVHLISQETVLYDDQLLLSASGQPCFNNMDVETLSGDRIITKQDRMITKQDPFNSEAINEMRTTFYPISNNAPDTPWHHSACRYGSRIDAAPDLEHNLFSLNPKKNPELEWIDSFMENIFISSTMTQPNFAEEPSDGNCCVSYKSKREPAESMDMSVSEFSAKETQNVVNVESVTTSVHQKIDVRKGSKKPIQNENKDSFFRPGDEQLDSVPIVEAILLHILQNLPIVIDATDEAIMKECPVIRTATVVESKDTVASFHDMDSLALIVMPAQQAFEIPVSVTSGETFSPKEVDLQEDVIHSKTESIPNDSENPSTDQQISTHEQCHADNSASVTEETLSLSEHCIEASEDQKTEDSSLFPVQEERTALAEHCHEMPKKLPVEYSASFLLQTDNTVTEPCQEKLLPENSALCPSSNYKNDSSHESIHAFSEKELETLYMQGTWISGYSGNNLLRLTVEENFVGNKSTIVADSCPVRKTHFQHVSTTEGGHLQSSSDTLLAVIQKTPRNSLQISNSVKKLIVFYTWVLKSHMRMKISTACRLCSEISSAFQAELLKVASSARLSASSSKSHTSVTKQTFFSNRTKTNMNQQNNSPSISEFDYLQEFLEALVSIETVVENCHKKKQSRGNLNSKAINIATTSQWEPCDESTADRNSGNQTSVRNELKPDDIDSEENTSAQDRGSCFKDVSSLFLVELRNTVSLLREMTHEIVEKEKGNSSDSQICQKSFHGKYGDHIKSMYPTNYMTTSDNPSNLPSCRSSEEPRFCCSQAHSQSQSTSSVLHISTSENPCHSFTHRNSEQPWAKCSHRHSRFQITSPVTCISSSENLSYSRSCSDKQLETTCRQTTSRSRSTSPIISNSSKCSFDQQRHQSRSKSPISAMSSSSDLSQEGRNIYGDLSSCTLKFSKAQSSGIVQDLDDEPSPSSSWTITSPLSSPGRSPFRSPEMHSDYIVRQSSSDDLSPEPETRRMQEHIELENFLRLERAVVEEEEQNKQEKNTSGTQQYYGGRASVPMSYPVPMESIPEESEEYKNDEDLTQDNHISQLNSPEPMSHLIDKSYRKQQDSYTFDDADMPLSDSLSTSSANTSISRCRGSLDYTTCDLSFKHSTLKSCVKMESEAKCVKEVNGEEYTDVKTSELVDQQYQNMELTGTDCLMKSSQEIEEIKNIPDHAATERNCPMPKPRRRVLPYSKNESFKNSSSSTFVTDRAPAPEPCDMLTQTNQSLEHINKNDKLSGSDNDKTSSVTHLKVPSVEQRSENNFPPEDGSEIRHSSFVMHTFSENSTTFPAANTRPVHSPRKNRSNGQASVPEGHDVISSNKEQEATVMSDIAQQKPVLSGTVKDFQVGSDTTGKTQTTPQKRPVRVQRKSVLFHSPCRTSSAKQQPTDLAQKMPVFLDTAQHAPVSSDTAEQIPQLLGTPHKSQQPQVPSDTQLKVAVLPGMTLKMPNSLDTGQVSDSLNTMQETPVLSATAQQTPVLPSRTQKTDSTQLSSDTAVKALDPSGISLKTPNLSGSPLKRVDLSGTALKTPDSSGSTLKEGDSSDTTWKTANLSGTTLKKDDSSGTSWKTPNMSDTMLKNGDLSCLMLKTSQLLDTTEKKGDSSGTLWKPQDLSHTILKKGDSSGRTRKKSYYSDLTLKKNDFSCTRLKASDMPATKLKKGDSSGTTWKPSDLSGGTPKKGDASDAILKMENLSGTTQKKDNSPDTTRETTNSSGTTPRKSDPSDTLLETHYMRGTTLEDTDTSYTTQKTSDLSGKTLKQDAFLGEALKTAGLSGKLKKTHLMNTLQKMSDTSVTAQQMQTLSGPTLKKTVFSSTAQKSHNSVTAQQTPGTEQKMPVAAQRTKVSLNTTQDIPVSQKTPQQGLVMLSTDRQMPVPLNRTQHKPAYQTLESLGPAQQNIVQKVPMSPGLTQKTSSFIATDGTVQLFSDAAKPTAVLPHLQQSVGVSSDTEQRTPVPLSRTHQKPAHQPPKSVGSTQQNTAQKMPISPGTSQNTSSMETGRAIPLSLIVKRRTAVSPRSKQSTALLPDTERGIPIPLSRTHQRPARQTPKSVGSTQQNTAQKMPTSPSTSQKMAVITGTHETMPSSLNTAQATEVPSHAEHSTAVLSNTEQRMPVPLSRTHQRLAEQPPASVGSLFKDTEQKKPASREITQKISSLGIGGTMLSSLDAAHQAAVSTKQSTTVSSDTEQKTPVPLSRTHLKPAHQTSKSAVLTQQNTAQKMPASPETSKSAGSTQQNTAQKMPASPGTSQKTPSSMGTDGTIPSLDAAQLAALSSEHATTVLLDTEQQLPVPLSRTHQHQLRAKQKKVLTNPIKKVLGNPIKQNTALKIPDVPYSAQKPQFSIGIRRTVSSSLNDAKSTIVPPDTEHITTVLTNTVHPITVLSGSEKQTPVPVSRTHKRPEHQASTSGSVHQNTSHAMSASTGKAQKRPFTTETGGTSSLSLDTTQPPVSSDTVCLTAVLLDTTQSVSDSLDMPGILKKTSDSPEDPKLNRLTKLNHLTNRRYSQTGTLSPGQNLPTFNSKQALPVASTRTVNPSEKSVGTAVPELVKRNSLMLSFFPSKTVSPVEGSKPKPPKKVSISNESVALGYIVRPKLSPKKDRRSIYKRKRNMNSTSCGTTAGETGRSDKCCTEKPEKSALSSQQSQNSIKTSAIPVPKCASSPVHCVFGSLAKSQSASTSSKSNEGRESMDFATLNIAGMSDKTCASDGHSAKECDFSSMYESDDYTTLSEASDLKSSLQEVPPRKLAYGKKSPQQVERHVSTGSGRTENNMKMFATKGMANKTKQKKTTLDSSKMFSSQQKFSIDSDEDDSNVTLHRKLLFWLNGALSSGCSSRNSSDAPHSTDSEYSSDSFSTECYDVSNNTPCECDENHVTQSTHSDSSQADDEENCTASWL